MTCKVTMPDRTVTPRPTRLTSRQPPSGMPGMPPCRENQTAAATGDLWPPRSETRDRANPDSLVHEERAATSPSAGSRLSARVRFFSAGNHEPARRLSGGRTRRTAVTVARCWPRRMTCPRLCWCRRGPSPRRSTGPWAGAATTTAAAAAAKLQPAAGAFCEISAAVGGRHAAVCAAARSAGAWIPFPVRG